jgi:protein-tyrosine-phosphatase
VHNAARSPLLEALLSLHYPGNLFFSGGMAAINGQKMPNESKSLARISGWGNLKESSENLTSQNKLIVNSDFIIAADKLVSDAIKNFHPSSRIFSAEHFSKEMGLRIIDPINLKENEFNYQVGKFLFCGFNTFRKVFDQATNFSITAVVCRANESQKEVERIIVSNLQEEPNSLVIDCDFKYAARSLQFDLLNPLQTLQIDAGEMIELSPKELENVSMLRPIHELSSWESFVTSREWRMWLKEISTHRPIFLLCNPIELVPGSLHNSFFEAMMSDRVILCN